MLTQQYSYGQNRKVDRSLITRINKSHTHHRLQVTQSQIECMLKKATMIVKPYNFDTNHSVKTMRLKKFRLPISAHIYSVSITTFRISSTILLHFVWIPKQNYNFPYLLSYDFRFFNALHQLEFSQVYLTAMAPLSLSEY